MQVVIAPMRDILLYCCTQRFYLNITHLERLYI